MATWFATAAGNINTAGRWNSAPDGSGSTLTWPPTAGDVLMANGFIVTVNVSVNLGAGELRCDTTGGATPAGYFNCTTAGVTVTANVVGGGPAYVLRGNNSGTTTWVGNITGGGVAAQYGALLSQGTINLTGTITGGAAYGILMSGGTINLTGNAVGGAVDAIRCNAATTVLTITGNSIASSVAPGVINASSGAVSIYGHAEASTGAAAIQNTAQGILQVGETRSASNGQPAVTGPFRYASATAAKSLPIVAGTQKTLAVLDVAALVPAETDVKAGVVYGDGAYTGTLSGGGGGGGSKKISMMGRI